MRRVGFTIIEVMMFLAITGLLLMGMLVGTGANLARERYNDGVATVEEFIAQQFNLVQNPERPTDGSNNQACIAFNASGNKLTLAGGAPDIFNSDTAYISTAEVAGEYRGRSDCLIYGRIIEFWYGTSVFDNTANDANGADNQQNQNSLQRIAATTVVGRDLENCLDTQSGAHGRCNVSNNDIDYRANLLTWTDEELIAATKIGRANDTTVFTPDWGVSLAGYTKTDGSPIVSDPETQPQGSILILRLPISGSVRTYITTNNDTRNIKTLTSLAIKANSTASRYFCVIPDGAGIWTPNRKIIRILQNIGNVSAVTTLPTDTASDDEGQLIQCRG
ncbi:MAG: prepilin-type N-terminal cleavage/methylation domain-containing protein [Candidatus Nomurabacteria bacterium]|jgi:type II secretory pathway pseudopilin PulG|nr:prepilin-type N-terminal cleavage/methylation domain-containing protein [Candidatus Nomurabacteria bacterium]